MLVVLMFFVIAILRVIQKIAYKNSSMMINGSTEFFRFGAVYQLLAGLLSVFAFIGYGTGGFNVPTVVCSLIMAGLFALDLYTGVEAVKEASLVVVNIYALGGLVLSCILSYFMFGETVSVFQGLGLVIFFIGVYLLTPTGKKEKHRLSVKTIIMLVLSFLANGFVMVTQKYFSLRVEGGNPAMFSFLTFIFNALFLFICWMVCIYKDKNNLCVNNTNSVLAEELPCENMGTDEKYNIKEESDTILNEANAEMTEQAETTETTKDAKKRKNHKRFLGMELIMYVYSIMMAVAVFGINLIVTELGKTVSSVILFPVSSAISIMITVLIGWLLYKEKLSIKAIIGLILGTISIILIGVFTPELVSGWF